MSHKYFWLILMTLLLGLQTILVFAQQEMPEEDFQLQGILIFLFIYRSGARKLDHLQVSR